VALAASRGALVGDVSRRKGLRRYGGFGARAAGADARSLRPHPYRSRLAVRAEARRVPLPRLHPRGPRADQESTRLEHDEPPPELAAALPPHVQLDGELIAWNEDGNPDFHRLCRRMLHGDPSVAVTYMAFDVLALDGEPTVRLPYVERHALLEKLVLGVPPSLLEVIGSFEDGPVLWDVVVARGMEGVVAKREREPYRPGARLWVKTKNRATARFQEELAARTTSDVGRLKRLADW
jgi:hypothetical protein